MEGKDFKKGQITAWKIKIQKRRKSWCEHEIYIYAQKICIYAQRFTTSLLGLNTDCAIEQK